MKTGCLWIAGVVGILLAIIVIFVLLFGLTVAGIRLGGVLQSEQYNAQRHAIEQSQQYVETKQEEMLSFWRQYNDPNATPGQQAAVTSSICEDSVLIQSSDWPPTMVGFINSNCP